MQRPDQPARLLAGDRHAGHDDVRMHTRHLLDRLLAAQGQRPAGAAAAQRPHRGRRECRVAEGLRRDHRRRGQRAHRHPARRDGGQPGRLRRLAEAHGQCPGRRPSARSGRAAGHQGQQERRLVCGRRRQRDGGRSGAAGG